MRDWGLVSCHWEAALTAREASQRKQAGKWQDLTPGLTQLQARCAILATLLYHALRCDELCKLTI